MSKRILKIAQIVITIGLVCLVLYLSGLFTAEGRNEFVQLLQGANLKWLFVSVLAGISINLCSAFKWYLLARSQNLGAGFWRIFAYYLVGQFYNQILPTSVGGDVVRSYELGKFSGRQADALASVFVERYTGVLVLLLLAGVAVLMQLSRFNQDFVVFSLGAFAIGLGFIAWMLFDQRFYVKVKKSLTKVVPVFSTVFTKVDKLLASVGAYRNFPAAIAGAFANSFLFYGVAVLNVYTTAMVFDLNVDLLDICVATPIIMLIMNLPISIGNFGLMEGAYAGVLKALGYDPLLGISIALLMRLKSLLDGLMGGVLHPIFVTQKAE